MANILSRDSLKTMQAFHRARFRLVGALVFLVCGVATLLALAPTYVLVHAERSAAAGSLEEVILPTNQDRDALGRAQILSKELQPFASSTSSLLAILDDVLSVRPKGVVVSNMSISRGSSGSIVLQGTTPSRDEINDYRTILLEDERFDRVSVPLHVLAGSEDGSFHISLTGAF